MKSKITIFLFILLHVLLMSCSNPESGGSGDEEVLIDYDLITDANLRNIVETFNNNYAFIYVSEITTLYLIRDFGDSLEISDFSGLDQFVNVTSVTMNNVINTSGDWSFLNNFPSLNYLNVCDYDSIDLSNITRLSQLYYLRLDGCNLTDTDLIYLEDCTSLKYLYLNSTNISSVTSLSELTQLQTLYLQGNNITDISSLTDLTNLRNLYLDQNDITNVSVLSNFLLLQQLSIIENYNLSNVSALSQLTNLTHVSLSSTPIDDISMFDDLDSIVQMDISSTSISDYSVITEMESLDILYASNLGFVDLTSIVDANLHYIYLNNCGITDITPLYNSTEFYSLSLYDNNIPTDQQEEIQSRFPNADISF